MASVKHRYIAGNRVYYSGNNYKSLYGAVGPDVIQMFDDFVQPMTVSSDTLDGWTTTLVEAGAGESTVTLSDASGGVLLLTTDAAENDGINLQKLGEAFSFSTSQSAVYFGIRLKASEATQSDFCVGLCITDTDLLGGMTDGVYFEKVDGATGISFTTEKDSTETQTDNCATFAADTYVLLEFYYDGASVEAFIDGTSVASHTTNIPDDELLTPSIQFLAGSAGAKTLSVDWIRAIQIGR